MVSNLKPQKIAKNELVQILLEMVGRVQADDSFGGFIEYDCIDSQLKEDEFFVRASYRIGNLEGQGGMKMIHDGFLT